MPKDEKTGALSGFLSYSHKNNNLGLITEIHKFLCGSLEQLFDDRFDIYFDNDDKNKEQGRLTDTIKSRIDGSNVFIPVISPSYCKAQGTAYHEFMYAQTRAGGESQLLIAPLILGEISREIENSVIWRHVRELMTFRLGNVLAAHDAALFTPTITTFAYTLHKKLSTDRTAQTTKARVALRDMRELIKDIESAANESTAHNAFRAQLIHNILEDVVKEIRTLNEPQYVHDISLDKSFVTRAKAIFEPANEIHAVSVDTSSSFWLNESTREIALSYTRVQPKRTFRVFVFSSPASMLKHRWVLHTHFHCYGEHGRVLMTSLSHWKRYLSHRGGEDAASRTSEDFGILSYPMKDADVLATLSRSALSFKDAEPSDFHLKVKYDFKSEAISNPHQDGNTLTLNPMQNNDKMFWLWHDAYANEIDTTAWHHCVADVFDGDIDFSPTYNSIVMHNILFSPRRADEEFEIFMKNIIDKLLKVKNNEGDLFVRSMWFGKVSEIRLKYPTDSLHADPLYFDEDVLTKWRYCLTLSFRSEKDLINYYRHVDHGPIRREVYSFLDENVKALYSHIEDSEKEGKKGSGMGDIIEKIMSKHMLRLDYAVPNPYIVYEAIEAPVFGSETQT